MKIYLNCYFECDIVALRHKLNTAYQKGMCFYYLVKTHFPFCHSLWYAKVCVATNGVVCFSACSSVWGYTLFYFFNYWGANMSELAFYSIVIIICSIALIFCIFGLVITYKRYKEELKRIKEQAEEEKKLKENIMKYIYPEKEYSKTYYLVKRGQILAKAITIKDDKNIIIAYEPKKIIFTSASVGGIRTGGIDTVGGYTYSAGEVENGKCQIVFFREKVIERIQLTPKLYKDAIKSDIKQYVDNKMQIIINNEFYGGIEALNYFNINDPVGSLAIQEMAKSGYPNRKKCEAIIRWICSEY